MAYLFNNYKRPKAELKRIDKFIESYEKSQNYYKDKDYLKALEELQISYNLLIDIWDEYPKIKTLYLMMNSFFNSKQYSQCLSLHEEITKRISIEKQRDKKISKEKHNLFLKIQARVSVYFLFINFIYDNLDNSIESVLDKIKYLSENNNLLLEDKIKYFWEYLKGFVKITGITKTKKYEIFKQDYDSMLITEKNNNSKDNNIDKPVKKIAKHILDKYKSFMNSKLRTTLYEILDREYFYVKFEKPNERVITFLQKNMNIYVRENNKSKLLEVFYHFLVLGKIDLKKSFNMTMQEMVHIQKRRIEKFDAIFANIVGAFNHIFKKYFNDEIEISFADTLIEQNKIRLSQNLKEIKKQIKMLKASSSNKNKIHSNNKIYSTTFDNNLMNNINIPPNTEEMDYKILLLKKKEKEMNAKSNINIFNKSNYGIKKILKNSNTVKKYPLHKNNFIFSDYLKTSNNIYKENLLNLPIILNNQRLNNNNSKISESTEKLNKYKRNNNYNAIKNIKSYLNFKTFEKGKNNDKNIIKEDFPLRNINNILITNLIDLFLSVYNSQHNKISEEESEKEEINEINYKKMVPRNIDLYLEFDLPLMVKSYSWNTIKGTKSTENQDSYFYYENYMLIKNFILFGVCDGHGEFGDLISNKICVLFPAYLIYIVIDDYLIKEKKDINKEIYKLFKIEENPKEVKDMYLLRYFFNKFNMEYNNLPFYKENVISLKKQIHEAFHYSHNDLKNRYNIDYEFSGTTLCSCFVFGDTLYIVNLGDSQIILGNYCNIYNTWEILSLSKKHRLDSPKESTRITKSGGRIERMRSKLGKEYGPLRVFDKDIESNLPGLDISRSLGDNFSKKLGVCYEPDITKYKLRKSDKIIVIGTDGLWKSLTNEEIINTLGKFYVENKNAEEASIYLGEMAKNKFIKSKNQKTKEKKVKLDKKRLIFEKEIEKNNENFDDITFIVIFLDF